MSQQWREGAGFRSGEDDPDDEDGDVADGDSLEDTSRAAGIDAISDDDLFDVLANQRRRYVLHLLHGRSEPIELGTMATRIAAWENGIDEAEVTSTERKRAYTALQQSHLPKMDEAGIVAFDKDRGTIEPAVELEDVEIYLDIVRNEELPWSDYYLGLAIASLTLLGAVWVGAWPFLLFPDLVWAAFIVAVFTVSAVAHRHYLGKTRLTTHEKPPELRD